MKRLALCLAIFSLACSGKDIRVSLQETGGASAFLSHHPSVCELAEAGEQAGIYKVASITGVYEEFPPHSNEWGPATYVELSLVEAWTVDAQDVTLRIHGGPVPDGFVAQFVDLSIDEVFAAIIEPPLEENANYSILTNDQIFREHDGVMTNGTIDAPRSDLEDLVSRTMQGTECSPADDIKPPRAGGAAPVDDEVGVEQPVNP